MNTTYKLELNSKPKLDKTHLILLRITQNKRHKRLSTGIFVFNNDFNKKAEFGKWIRRSNSKYQKLNQVLKEKISEAEEIHNQFEKNNQSISASNIVKAIKTGNTESTESFIKFYEDRLSKYYDSHSASYYKNVKAKLKKLKLYLKEIKVTDLLFKEINVKFLKDYEHYLLKEGLKENSRIDHFKKIRSVLYEAMEEDLYEGKNPFKGYKIKSMKANKTKLSIDEIRKIEELNLPEYSVLWHTKNFFLFDFYCAGIRIADFMQLKWNNIKEGRLEFKMGKTGRTHSVKLILKAISILNFYKTDDAKNEDYIFPIIENKFRNIDKHSKRSLIDSKNAVINKNLKQIQKLLSIETNISFHISRHSFADILRQKDKSIYDIKTLLGHTSIRQTENYLKGFDPITADKVHEEALESI